MTIGEAAKRGIRKIRKPVWTRLAHLEIVLVNGGADGYGVWADLYDPWGQKAIGQPTPQKVLLSMLYSEDEDDWEEYVEEEKKGD